MISDLSASSTLLDVTSLLTKMASKKQDSTTSSEEDGEERALFTRKVEIVEKAKRGLFEEQAAEEQAVEEQAARRTRASTSAKPPVRDYVSLSMSSYHDDSDQDKTLEECELKKKQLGFSSGK